MGDMVSFASNGGTADGYLAEAAGGGPGLIVVQEWWGLVDHVKDLAERFAAAGFTALAPDFFHGAATDEPDEAMRLMMGLAMDQAAKDVAGAADLPLRPGVGDEPGARRRRVLHGRLARPVEPTVAENIQAAVGFYPAMPWERMNPDWPGYTGKAAMIHCSEEDGTSAAPGIRTAVEAIEAAGGTVEVFDYPGTQHAFFNDDRPEVHDAEATAAAWDRTVAFLHDRLG